MSYTWKYYDLVLLGIVTSVAIGGVVGYATTVSPPIAIIVASVAAIAIIAHGLFVNGPVDGPEDLAEEVEALN